LSITVTGDKSVRQGALYDTRFCVRRHSVSRRPVGFIARGEAAPQPKTHAADLAAIEKLHKEDVDSTLTQDIRRR
jgi:hypothetical protein